MDVTLYYKQNFETTKRIISGFVDILELQNPNDPVLTLKSLFSEALRGIERLLRGGVIYLLLVFRVFFYKKNRITG